MKRAMIWVLSLSVLAGIVAPAVTAASPTKEEFQKLKDELKKIRQQVEGSRPVGEGVVGRADATVGDKYGGYGPNEKVTTRSGNLKVGGLLQVWFYTIQNDQTGWVDPNQANGGGPAGFGSNEVSDNDGFRVRRAQLRFTMDIHENVTGYVAFDTAREAQSFPNLPQNQSQVKSGDGTAYYNSGSAAGGNFNNGVVQSGAGSPNFTLQDAYINVHGIIPHHDFTTGQFKRHLGEEGTRDEAYLDFVERSQITALADLRDLGSQVHGSWWDERLQYWLGAFNGAGTAFQHRGNRGDDNDDKDWVAAILLRPLWKNEKFGSIEIGYSIMHGKGGESGGRDAAQFNGGGTPVDGLQRNRTVHQLQYAYLSWKAGEESPVSGWWIRGEWGQYRDRFAPTGEVASTAAAGVGDPAPFNVEGWYVSTGYRISESIWGEGLRSGGDFGKYVLEPMEFTFRFDRMENLFYQDLDNPGRELDVFTTDVITAGFNYYIKGHNAKLQVNYNWVNEEDKADNPNGRELREVRNNNLVVNFQVHW
ncbi:MAG: OprO/OprP family phosphate-selective porin [Planctomycetota bacterium]|nr:OprO/OprP family phosphate-selective porin [Planctomycetota bacterium]